MSSASFRKEPSMDEILASIRRIIESGDGPNEPKGQQADDPETSTRDMSNSHRLETTSPATDDHVPMPRFDVRYLNSAANERAYSGPVDDLNGQAAVDRGVEAGPAHASAEQPVSSSSFEDDHWELRSTDVSVDRPGAEVEYDRTERGDGSAIELDFHAARAGNENDGPGADGGDANPEAARDFAFEFDDAAFEAALRNDAWQTPTEREDAVEPEADTVVEFAPVEASSNVEQAPATESTSVKDTSPSAEQRSMQVPDSVIAGASALLSAQAGDQVAAAFDDLTHAIREGHMRSMEEMSRELLRPMLQEWLEDNLPRIVERLVREEIERIARAPRR